MTATQKSIWISAVVALLFIALTGALVKAAPPPIRALLALEPPRTGTDPLSGGEAGRAQQLALQTLAASGWVQSARQLEVLLVERHAEPKTARQPDNWPRRADVYAYDYATDTLLRSTINLESGAVEQVETGQAVQPPLTPTETGRALALALADAALGPAIGAEFQRITGQPLLNPGQQLNVHALIFRADSLPNRELGVAAACGVQRCAQLLIATPGDFLINLLPVVNLSQGSVVNAGQFVQK